MPALAPAPKAWGAAWPRRGRGQGGVCSSGPWQQAWEPCSQSRGAAGSARAEDAGLCLLLRFASAFALLRDPAPAAPLGLGVGLGVSRRLRLTFASDYGRKQHCRKTGGPGTFVLTLTLEVEGPWWWRAPTSGLGKSGFKSQLCHLLAEWPQMNPLTSLILKIPSSWTSDDAYMRSSWPR